MRVGVPAEHAEYEALAERSQILGREVREDGCDVLVASRVLSWVARRAIEHLGQILDVDALAAWWTIEALDEEHRSIADRGSLRKGMNSSMRASRHGGTAMPEAFAQSIVASSTRGSSLWSGS